MYILCALTFAGAVLMTFITGYGYFATIAVIAFAYGGPSALNAALCTDLFGAKHSGTNYGVAMLALGFSSIFFNWVSNNILKATVENVTSTFIMGAVTALIPVVLMIIIQRTLNKRDAAKAEG
ncbi:MAG: hypothetical protein LUH36_04370, partial [Oscillospiraceae bacterium]|nr:hypothetical protein [Oscillospiraceae bacterium]